MSQAKVSRVFKLLRTPFVLRLTYLCDLLFGGKFCELGKAAGLPDRQIRFLAKNGTISSPDALGCMVSAGLVNAEWLLCGTGPMSGPAPRLEMPSGPLPTTFSSSFPVFSPAQAMSTSGAPVAPMPSLPPTVARIAAIDSAAEAVYKARADNKPVLLALDSSALYAGAGQFVTKMLRSNYVTGLLLTGDAATADLEVALFGGATDMPWAPQELSALGEAALLGARHGLGYGEALGRWGFPAASNRQHSVLAVAHELGVPATVHVLMGESLAHFLPAKHGAEIGAAIGAVTYTDMLILAQQLVEFQGETDGLVLDADSTGLCRRVFLNAWDTAWRKTQPFTSLISLCGSSEPRRLFSALLTACNVTYDGTAHNGRRNRVRSSKELG